LKRIHQTMNNDRITFCRWARAASLVWRSPIMRHRNNFFKHEFVFPTTCVSAWIWCSNQSAWHSPQPRLRESIRALICAMKWIQISVLIIVYCKVVGKFENLKFSKLPFMRTCQRKDEKTAPKDTGSFVAIRPTVRPFDRVPIPQDSVAENKLLFVFSFDFAFIFTCDVHHVSDCLVDRRQEGHYFPSLPSLPASAS
jgi:hypothetical protein